MDKKLDLNLVRVFEMLLEEESATRAAIRLDTSQASVSAALARLRQVYGDVLFYRRGRGMTPTTRALELAPEIRKAMDSIRATLGPADDLGRHVLLGMSDDIEMAYAPQLIAQFARDMPSVIPVFRQSHSAIAAELLQERNLDLAIGSGGLTARGLTRVSLGTSGYLSVSKHMPTGGKLDLDEFCHRPHLLVSSGGLSGVVDTALAAQGRSRRVVASTTHFSAVPFLLHDDLIATIPAHAAKAIERLGILRTFVTPVDLGTYPIEASVRSSDMRNSVIRGCLESVKVAFAKDTRQSAPGLTAI